MDNNGMTEEEYLNSLLGNYSEEENSEEEENSDTEESSDAEGQAVIDKESAVEGEETVREETAVSENDTIYADEKEVENNEQAYDLNELLSSINGASDIFAESSDTEDAPTEDASENTLAEDGLTDEEKADLLEDSAPYEDFSDELASVIGDIKKDSEDSKEESDVFSQIDNTELTAEELNQDADDMSLFETVDALLNEEGKDGIKKDESGTDLEIDLNGSEFNEKKKKTPKKRVVRGFLSRVKNFLKEQGEDTDEDIAKSEKARLAKEEKERKKAEELETKLEKRNAKKEAKAQKKAEKKETKAVKEAEKQAKKERKKTERAASNEHKYKVTLVKLILLFTVVASFGILLWAISDFNYRRVSKKNAMTYFTADQYELAYEAIAGLKPNNSEVVFFEQVKTVMYVQKQYDSYLNYYNIGMKEEALNALLKGIDKYDKYYENADDLGILEDMNIVLNKIAEALEESYGISVGRAKEVANIEDPVEYSMELRKIISSIN